MAEGLSTRYQDLLSGSYDCVDRIVLNAYFRMGHDAGGFRLWWRQLTGSDATLDNAHLMRLAAALPGASVATPRRTTFLLSAVQRASVNMRLLRTISGGPPFRRDCSWS